MKTLGIKLQKARLIMMSMVGFIVGMSGCEDRFDTPRPSVERGERVEVSLCVGIADEEDRAVPGDSQANTKAMGNSGFDVRLVSATDTKALMTTDDPLATAKPDKLYGLQILQYQSSDSGSDFMKLVTVGDVSIGSTLNIGLTASDNCQLVIVARGSGNTVPPFSGTPTWSNLQKITADTSVMNNLKNINAMPYILHLPHVKIKDGKLQSPDGEDVRLLLKRLAARLSINWTFSEDLRKQDYVLREIRLCQLPAFYQLFPLDENTDKWGRVFPASVLEFIDYYRLIEDDLKNPDGTPIQNKTIWIPANAKGRSSSVTSVYYRTKEYAHSAATYVEFVVDNSKKEERLYYRVYLGGNEVNDFNLLENTNYNWIVNINKTDYISDPRIRLLDQTPVLSSNLVTTANCFMMCPGTNICFNPYKHTAGTNGWNEQLVSNPSGTPMIKSKIGSVKVLWQTKDNGTTGDLVLGYVIEDSNHKNLVNLTGEGLDGTRVNVKVPITEGGNALIAAYDESGNTILWSWHIWVTNYVPVGISSTMGYQAAQLASRPGSVHQYDSPMFSHGGVYEKKVMMDRDLGARAGGFPYIATEKGNDFTTQDAVKTYGLLYQWGRKDPFFTSMDGTDSEKDIIYDGYGIPKGVSIEKSSANAEQESIKKPLFFMTAWATYWSELSVSNNPWNKSAENKAPGVKTIYDPCPVGWKMPMMFDQAPGSSVTWNDVQDHSMFTNFALTDGNIGKGLNNQSDNANYNYTRFLYFYDGKMLRNARGLSDSRFGRVFFIGQGSSTDLAGKTIDNTVWIPATSERNGGKLAFGGQYGHFWGADVHNKKGMFVGYRNYDFEMYGYSVGLGWPVRCIQE